MVTPTIYKLTALTDLRYKLRERPTPKDGYPIKSGASITITKEALAWIRLVHANGKSAGTKDYALAKL